MMGEAGFREYCEVCGYELSKLEKDLILCFVCSKALGQSDTTNIDTEKKD